MMSPVVQAMTRAELVAALERWAPGVSSQAPTESLLRVVVDLAQRVEVLESRQSLASTVSRLAQDSSQMRGLEARMDALGDRLDKLALNQETLR